MNTTLELSARNPPPSGAADKRPSSALGPRIYYLSPLLAGPLRYWPALLDHVAGLGFDHVLLAPPFVPGRTGDLFLPADFRRLHPLLGWERDAEAGLRWLAEACRERQLRLLLDLVPDRLAAGSEAARTHPDLFAGPEDISVLDPRRGHGGSEAARARFDRDALFDWWSTQIGRWTQAGVAGFRVLRLGHLPAGALGRLIASVRHGAPHSLWLGWTPGLTGGEMAALAGSGLDFTFSSLPWWDFRSEWLWTEADALGRVAPPIAMPEAPFEPRLFGRWHDPALQQPAYRRALMFAASTGPGWLMPMGFEYGAAQTLDPARDAPEDWDTLRENAPFDLSPVVAAINAARAAEPAAASPSQPRLLSGPGANVTAVLRTDAADARFADRAILILANALPDRRSTVTASSLLVSTDAVFPRFGAMFPASRETDVVPGTSIVLEASEVVLLAGQADAREAVPRPLLSQTAQAAAEVPRVSIENVTPRVEGGSFPVKRIVGDTLEVEADVIADGHEVVSVALLWRNRAETQWREKRMRPLGNDRWTANLPLEAIGTYEFVVEAWRDAFATWRDEVAKKHAAGVNTALEIQEGLHLIETTARRSDGRLAGSLRSLAGRLAAIGLNEQRAVLLSRETQDLMAKADPRPSAARTEPALSVQAERTGAQFASWYEIFPRSMSDDEQRHGTFDDVIRHLPRIRDMGFDVLYFPPIHPIGRKNRKGRNNSLHATPNDPGSPYAIGSEEGGHEALHPELGSIEDFRRMREAAAAHGLELALDFAIQASPDHPWLREHKDWFAWRPDGTIKYAENPPKKYEDIVNFDFYAAGAIPGLWTALCEVVMHWAAEGVRLFRVDNPHTKPFPFWEWLIAEVRARYPDAIFLAEAFTRPKLMYRLAKVGFSQSYTYFTWRNTKAELQDYLTELTTTAPRDFFRPHFFVNTPDINPIFLQSSGRAGFLIRAALAGTLSGLWGVYCGFELCEASPMPGKEEYLDSEKYQLRAWDWNRPGNIVPEITRLNQIRRLNPALHTHLGVKFHNAFNDTILFYSKSTLDRSNVVLVAVSLDPHNVQEADIEAPLWDWGLGDAAALEVEDLLRGGSSIWRGKTQHVRLDPASPYAIWRARPAP